MASLRKRGSRWQAQVRRQGLPVLSKSFSTKADAQAWSRIKEAAIEAGEVSYQLRDLTLTDILNRYEESHTRFKKGAAQERYKLGVIRRHRLVALSLEKLTAGAIAAYRDDRLAVVGRETVRKELALMHTALDVARREWGIPLGSNPVAAVKRPPKGRARDRRLAEGEFGKLVEALNTCRNPEVQPIVLLAIATGMRRGELLALRWADVNLSQGLARIRDSKNGHPRDVPLSPDARAVLVQIGPTEGAIFNTSPNGLRQAWERVKRRAGIQGLRFHDLRHEAVSRFFEAGLSVPEVALISGHRDPRMLATYTHLRASDVASKLSGTDAHTRSYSSTNTTKKRNPMNEYLETAFDALTKAVEAAPDYDTGEGLRLVVIALTEVWHRERPE